MPPRLAQGALTRRPVDYSHEVRHHDSRLVRALLVVAGFAFIGLGILGVFLPVLPTTPFLLLAAACFARASARFYNLLLNSRTFGPLIVEWRRHRAIPWRTKLWAIGLMASTLAVSVVFFVREPWLQVALGGLGVLLAAWMASIPSRDRGKT